MAKKSESKQKPSKDTSGVSREEQVGFHKGSLMTLSKERAELVRILGIVEQLMQMHASALGELGVKLDETSAAQPTKPKKPPIEDIL